MAFTELNGFTVPRVFKFLGETIKVLFKDEPFIERPDAVGLISYRLGEIYLRRPNETYPRNNSQLQVTYLHEVLHLVFEKSGIKGPDEGFLYNNEPVIDLLASMLHQILSTGEGDLLQEVNLNTTNEEV